jgi:hypothetical protein
MTKRNLLLVSLLLVLGLVGMTTNALATSWTVNGNTNYFGRAEGLSEAAGQVVLNLTGGGSINSWPAGFTFTFSQPVVTETAEVSCAGGTVGANSSPWVGGCGDTLVLPPTYGAGSTFGTPSTYTNTVKVYFTSGVTTTFYTGDNSQLVLTVRIYPAALGKNGGSVTATVGAFNPTGGVEVSLGNNSPPNPVLIVNPLPALSLTLANEWGAKAGQAAGVLTCLGTKSVDGYKDYFVINVDENFQDALTSETYETTLDPGDTSGSASVTNGSDFIVTFTNVPTGLGIELADVVPCSDLDTANPMQCNAPGPIYGTLAVAPVAPYSGTGTVADSNTVSFYFVVTATDNTAATNLKESVDLSFYFRAHGALPNGLPAMYANVAYAPTLTALLPIPYFTGANELASPGLAVVYFYDCVTNMLFPYINTYRAGGTYAFANFGTGIALANTTLDPYNGSINAGLDITGKGGAVAQNGTCTLYLYPNDLTAAQAYTTGVISSGGTAVFDVATVAPGFANKQGYGIAICNFEDGYGYAEIYDNVGIGSPTATLAYLPYIIPNPSLYPRSPAGDGLGASAIAPYDIAKQFAWLLMHGFGGMGFGATTTK